MLRAPPPSRAETEKALQELRSEIEAQPRNARAIGVDAQRAAETVLRCLPMVETMGAEITSLGVSGEMLAGDRQAALATCEAHARVRYASRPTGPIRKTFEELVELRDRLVSTAMTMAKHKLMAGSVLGTLRGAVGYQKVADDIVMLADALLESWSAIEGKVPVTEEGLADAKARAAAFLERVRRRNRAESGRSSDAILRNQALALLLERYEHVRRAVHHARWFAGDANTIAPSLLAKPNAGRRAAVRGGRIRV
jgi:hypothetical protein